ncbi:DUF302 domain-containing protein [Salinicola aestuarinus]|uniref:DUF302 domain-containing protein n=1 Tax=Salinicola aestuarinus TaxID=1949082 RepID=UPI000DA1D82A|nr:DUF302 domain-containing protein [Salinicola aestuarinus]
MPFAPKRWLTLALCLTALGVAGGVNAQSTETTEPTTSVDAAGDVSRGDDVAGLIRTPVDGRVHEVAGRFVTAARQSGLTVFARIDHRQAAISRDLALLPNEVILFGSARGGTPMMQCAATAGIDLPMKALVWQDDDGQTWLGYNDPAWIAARHGIADCDAVAPLQQSLDALVETVKAP